MAELKTTRSDSSVDDFLDSVDNQTRKRDALVVRDLMSEITGEKAEMWGTSILGYGRYRYTPKGGGAEHEWFKVGFSPRKASLTFYIMDGFSEYDTLLGQLGSYSTGKSCLYIRDLDEVDLVVLRELITSSVAAVDGRNRQA
ncbi:MAG TPA: DUF1801 domain-containing protein [Acidimicrobiia bacterium]|nr:DUF1801 domain-containing protein [Acidimicrobiia bacterium]